MAFTEGYTKYRLEFSPGPWPWQADAGPLLSLRQRMVAKGWIGWDPVPGVGFGNVSIRLNTEGQFLITGTQTGGLPQLSEAHLSWVLEADPAANFIRCTGGAAASSEALTHAAVYAAKPAVNVVIHLHNREAWARLMHHLPVTHPDVLYGTPAMAAEVQKLLSGLPSHGLLVMGGHEEGLLAWGSSCAEAEEHLQRWVG